MLEKMKSVNNPLTIIALFAALAEVAGTVAIKLVAPELQSRFIWFVMFFPIGLVLLFFVTLWFKDRVLYAPGDFKDEKNYLALVNAKQSFGIEEIRVMLGEAKAEILSGVAKTIPASGRDESLDIEKLLQDIEELVQNKLQPVQSFAGALKESSDYSLLSTVAAHTEQNECYIWQLLHDESKPMTLKEIASRLSLNEYAASLILYSLISREFVKEHPDDGNGITYSAIPLRFEDLNHWRSYLRERAPSK
jgi:hypothetical protein